MKYSDISAAG